LNYFYRQKFSSTPLRVWLDNILKWAGLLSSSGAERLIPLYATQFIALTGAVLETSSQSGSPYDQWSVGQSLCQAAFWGQTFVPAALCPGVHSAGEQSAAGA
jgi:hypothetical protein